MVFRSITSGGDFSSLQSMDFDCDIYQFSSQEELFAQCASACPGRKVIHRDVTADEPLTVRDLPTRPTDRDIRQGVLVALYEYHARFPERFLKFDVTPDHLARSLGLEVRDVYRVLGPMDEAGEVRTLQDARDVLPRYVTVTQRGIEAMQDEPLFESKGVRVMDNSIRIEGNHNQVAREHGRNEQQNVQLTASALGLALDQLRQVRSELEGGGLPPQERVEALETIDMVFEEAERPEPRRNRLLTNLNALHRLLERNPGTVAAAGTVAQIVAALAAGG